MQALQITGRTVVFSVKPFVPARTCRTRFLRHSSTHRPLFYSLDIMMAVAHTPVGVATAVTTISGRRPAVFGHRIAALSDNWPLSFMIGNSKIIGSDLSAAYIFDPNMVYNLKRTTCLGLSKAVNRSGPLSHCLRTDEAFGAAISKLRQRQRSPKGLICSALDASMGGSDSASFATLKTQGQYRRRPKQGFECFGSPVADVGSVALAMEWRPAVDQVMLVTSVALAYLAGIVTPKKPNSLKRPVDAPPPQTGCLLDEREISRLQSERETESRDLGTEAHEGDPWGIAQAKLGMALSRLSRKERDVSFYEVKDKAVRNPVLSLQALMAGPRLRLLVLALEHLHTQVNLITESNKSLPSAEWSKLTLDVLCGSVEPICRTWLAQEPCLVDAVQQGSAPVEEQRILKTKEPPKVSNALGDPSPEQSVNLISQGRALVLDYLQRSGKTELYMDLLFFLRFQTMRRGGCCDFTVMSRHVTNALEDLVVALADGAATIYLGRDPQIGGLDSDWPILVRPSIKSTRALERFRNEIALQSWFQRNYTSVVAMFEDRFELWKIERAAQQMKDDDPVEELRLKRVEFPARRGKELRALTGWRYIYSLYLEFSDIVGPLLEVFVKKLGEAVSFLLVRLIGRSLGLIFEGIRQSVRWGSK